MLHLLHHLVLLIVKILLSAKLLEAVINMKEYMALHGCIDHVDVNMYA